MIIKHLGHTDFNMIMECFLSSFENYYVKMPTDYNFYKERWNAARVDFNSSYGMFDGNQLVGFIIHAIDKRYGHHIAFNTGTGVIPEYRGQKIVKSIYEYAIPNLKRNGITKCALEVITENEKAIRAYKSIGFNICKHYKCYNGTISVGENHVSLKEVKFQDMNWDVLPNQEFYSWDNYNQCLSKGSYRYFQVLKEATISSYFVINSETGYISQLEVLNDSNDSWNDLFAAIYSINKTIKINNIDDRLISKIKAVESVGLINSVNQYEMELSLSS
ncbi:GNAT family N-acetyltransferase [Psychroserpens sp.]|uniref:GNAT family N-acetyltransferase n=1 Tax=Psychroserpens sp. TaxID=2020870 RepID=UPI00385A9218